MRIKSLGLENVRAVEWIDTTQEIRLIDQRLIPFEISFTNLSTTLEVNDAIKTMVVRGAPAIGVTAAYGMVLAVKETLDFPPEKRFYVIKEKYDELITTRPTAVDLENCARKVLDVAIESNYSIEKALKSAQNITEEILTQCKQIGIEGERIIEDNDSILTHCHAGALATVDYGTALAPIHRAHNNGKNLIVFVDETRPRLQGAKITAWELSENGINHHIITDNMAAHFMSEGRIKKVILGADRCLLDGSIVNKIGTLNVAIIAKHYDIPFYSAFPWSTIDYNSESAEDVEIEYRDENEVKYVKINKEEILIANDSSPALNPAFDITPQNLITGYITPKGVIDRLELKEYIEKERKN